MNSFLFVLILKNAVRTASYLKFGNQVNKKKNVWNNCGEESIFFHENTAKLDKFYDILMKLDPKKDKNIDDFKKYFFNLLTDIYKNCIDIQSYVSLYSEKSDIQQLKNFKLNCFTIVELIRCLLIFLKEKKTRSKLKRVPK
ncbi:hypothetical protein EDEG_00960 [Edhazardia aedis USNM 41457]|uniref:Uncharacterized protein n=1 Tax=Edhazardia aedis (strain USNM 41457) TaxID=1003232 RepID=J9DAQ8_EDHAE|nr:hypothetical protein EDEG_00960 [Edhazardia aedis USNM 41457]|eukprot:EJW04846.1 hypothetical protein EDEG_00960 [Edhazardia aedis USNM 41457]